MAGKTTIALLCFLLVACCSRKTGSSSSTTTEPKGASVAKAGPDATAEEPAASSQPSPTPEQAALAKLLEENMSRSLFAVFGPVSALAVGGTFVTAATRDMQGPGACYLVVAACGDGVKGLEMSAVDGKEEAAPSAVYLEKEMDADKLAGWKICPVEAGLVEVRMKANPPGGSCAVGILGN
jgi:hypothetical protein